MASTRSSGCVGQKAALLVALALTCVVAVMSARLGMEGSQRPSTEGTLPAVEEIASHLDEERGESDKEMTEAAPIDEDSIGEETKTWDQSLEALGQDVESAVSERREAGEVAEVARTVLEGYRKDTCILVSSGYVDLLGGVWGCVTQGSDWVDICVVRQDGDRVCAVRCIRLSPSGEEVTNAV